MDEFRIIDSAPDYQKSRSLLSPRLITELDKILEDFKINPFPPNPETNDHKHLRGPYRDQYTKRFGKEEYRLIYRITSTVERSFYFWQDDDNQTHIPNSLD
jgi:mRNA-degrading endonuclease RelE of RelBE toxin-antitoxin system